MDPTVPYRRPEAVAAAMEAELRQEIAALESRLAETTAENAALLGRVGLQRRRPPLVVWVLLACALGLAAALPLSLRAARAAVVRGGLRSTPLGTMFFVSGDVESAALQVMEALRDHHTGFDWEVGTLRTRPDGSRMVHAVVRPSFTIREEYPVPWPVRRHALDARDWPLSGLAPMRFGVVTLEPAAGMVRATILDEPIGWSAEHRPEVGRYVRRSICGFESPFATPQQVRTLDEGCWLRYWD
jgi:hypothetical protein